MDKHSNPAHPHLYHTQSPENIGRHHNSCEKRNSNQHLGVHKTGGKVSGKPDGSRESQEMDHLASVFNNHLIINDFLYSTPA